MSTQPQRSGEFPRAPQQSPLAAILLRWAARPLYDVNRRAIVWTALPMMLIVFMSQREPGQVVFIRNIAMLFIGMHGFWHVVLLNVLGKLRDKGIAEAGEALRCYLAPRRITNLDLAIAWAAFVGLVSLYRTIFPMLPPAVG